MIEALDSGGKISLEIGRRDSLYVRRDKLIQGDRSTRVSVSVPAPFSAAAARLFRKSYVMQRVSTKGGQSGRIHLTCPGGKQFVALRLSGADTLSVSLSHVVAYSRGIQFASMANLSIAAFACDRNFTTTVTGTGMVVFETSGNHQIHTSGSCVFDPNQLVAWNADATFTLDEVHSVTDLYFNRVRISCEVGRQGAPLIIDSVPKSGAVSANPLLGFIRSIYLPKFR